jgi:hypothetical protein
MICQSGKRRARWVDRLLHERHVALGVDHHAFRLGPQRARQQNVGIAVGFGVEKRVLRDHQFCGLQTGNHRLPVGDACNGIGADNPACLDFARPPCARTCLSCLCPTAVFSVALRDTCHRSSTKRPILLPPARNVGPANLGPCSPSRGRPSHWAGPSTKTARCRGGRSCRSQDADCKWHWCSRCRACSGSDPSSSSSSTRARRLSIAPQCGYPPQGMPVISATFPGVYSARKAGMSHPSLPLKAEINSEIRMAVLVQQMTAVHSTTPDRCPV